MTELDQIEQLLDCIAAGNSGARSELLPLLAAHIVLIPMTEVRTSGDRGETKKIKLATLNENGTKVVPVFTSEELFFNWSEERYQCLPIAVEDLALTLSPDNQIAVNLLTPQAIYFTVADFQNLEAADESAAAAGLGSQESARPAAAVETGYQALEPPGAETAARPASPGFIPTLVHGSSEPGLSAESVSSVTAFAAGQQSAGEPGAAAELAASFASHAAEGLNDRIVINELRALLKEFSHINEAYFTTSGGEHGRGILGVLADQTDSEKRFTLISAVADLSRTLLGYAGAIDVYDDLHDRQSGSWNLFVALTPFYIRADGRSDYHEPEHGLSDIESEKLPGDHRLVLLPEEADADRTSRRRGSSGVTGKVKEWLGGFRSASRR